MRRRRGQGTLELILALIGLASLLAFTLQILDAARVRLALEAGREAAASAAFGGAEGLEQALGDHLDERLRVDLSGCDGALVPSGVRALDDALVGVEVRVRSESLGGLYEGLLRLDERLCQSAGTATLAELGGELLEVDPDPWLAGADDHLAPLF